MIELKNLYFEELKLKDVYFFKNWQKHKSILFYDYNFVEKTDSEIINWYNWKKGILFSKHYTIFYEEIPIGYISLKNINNLLKRATIGITIDPKYIDRGIGTEILYKFLKYLKENNFKKVYLYVADFNKRAMSVYEKIGFCKKSKVLMLFRNGNYDESNEDFIKNKNSFKIMLNRTFFYAYKMEKKL